MTRLTFDAYLDHIRTESARFRDVLANTDPNARVPTCPDWSATDLLWHLTEVQHFWTYVVTHRPAAPDGYSDPARPAPEELVATFDRTHAGLLAALSSAEPGEQAWTWATEQSVGFVHRRQAHEALIHRLDADLTAGEVTELDARLAADGVAEALGVMFGATPDWGTFTGTELHVRVDSIDTDQHVWVQLGRFTGTDPEGTSHDQDDIEVVDDPGVEPDAVVSGTAADLDAWLWRRRDDSGITVAGDPAAYALFAGCVNQPID